MRIGGQINNLHITKMGHFHDFANPEAHVTKRWFSIYLLAALLMASQSKPALAQGMTNEPVTRLEVIPANRITEGQKTIRQVILRMHIPQGYKTYWRHPGEAGLPPQLDWTGSENVKHISWDWPVPEVDGREPSRSLVLGGVLDVLLHVHIKEATKPIVLALKLSHGLCKEICLPAEATAAQEIRPEQPIPTTTTQLKGQWPSRETSTKGWQLTQQQREITLTFPWSIEVAEAAMPLVFMDAGDENPAFPKEIWSHPDKKIWHAKFHMSKHQAIEDIAKIIFIVGNKEFKQVQGEDVLKNARQTSP